MIEIVTLESLNERLIRVETYIKIGSALAGITFIGVITLLAHFI